MKQDSVTPNFSHGDLINVFRIFKKLDIELDLIIKLSQTGLRNNRLKMPRKDLTLISEGIPENWNTLATHSLTNQTSFSPMNLESVDLKFMVHQMAQMSYSRSCLHFI